MIRSDTMPRAKIPGIATPVSRIAFGCMSTIGNQMYAGLSEADAIATMRGAFDLGINLFDTARAYANGESEARLGRAVAPFRDEVVIASKPAPGAATSDEIVRECELSLRSLNTDRIDLYQLHWPSRAAPIAETAAAMDSLVRSGKVVAVGVCNFGALDLGEWLGAAPCATNQVAYSLISRGVEFEVQAACERHGVGILCYSPLGQGLLTGRYSHADEVPSGRARTRHFSKDRPEARHPEPGCETLTFAAVAQVRRLAEAACVSPAELSLAWLLRRASVTCVLAGASSPHQVESNVRAASIQLSDETVGALSAATEAVKDVMGPSLDLWESPPRTR